jgi:hypothetical protein
MGNKLLITTVLAALVMVGAGCGPKAEPTAPPAAPPAAEQESVSDPVDSEVDAIIDATMEEDTALEGEAGETVELNAADGEVQAFSESAYEVK